MKIYTCKDRLEDIMTCIYDAWADALLIGHDQIVEKRTDFPDNIIGRIYPCRWGQLQSRKSHPVYPQRYFFQSISVCVLRIPFSRRRRTADNL